MTLFLPIVTLRNVGLCNNSIYGGLVVIRTWFKTKSFLLFTNCILIHRCHEFLISKTHSSVTSLPCWGRVVIGSLVVYQTTGAGSNPVTSTTVLTVSDRSIGNGQKIWICYAWEGLERSGPFPISPAFRATLLFQIDLVIHMLSSLRT